MNTTRLGETLKPLSSDLLKRMDACWRTANDLSVGQIYLYDNPLLKRPPTLVERQQYICKRGRDLVENRNWKWKG